MFYRTVRRWTIIKVFLTVDNTDYKGKKKQDSEMDAILEAYKTLIDMGLQVQLKFTNLPVKENK